MARRKAAIIAAELEVLRAELVELDGHEEPTEQQIARSTTALDEFDTLTTEHDEAVAYEQRIARAIANPANREEGSGTGYLGGRGSKGPEIKRNIEPYADLQLVRANRYDNADVISRALKAAEIAPGHMSDIARAHVQKLIEVFEGDDNKQAPLIARHILLTGSPEYHEEFREYMQTGYVGGILRASMSLTDANGGYLVPFTLDPTIILTNAGIADPLRQISTIKQIATDTWNGVTSAGATSSWTAEGGEAGDGTPTFGGPQITPKRADTWVEGTYEVLADSGFASSLGRLLADSKVRHEGAAFATGNVGATRPRGVVAAVAAVTASIVASAATNAFARGDVDNVADALRPRDAGQAKWLANKKIYTKIRQFDTSGGSAWWANMGMGRPSELLGAQAYEASTMQSAVTTAGLVLLAGNFEEYYIVDRIGMSVMYNPMLMGLTTGRPTGKAGWLALWRVGADVVDPDAFRLLQLNATAAAVALA